MVTDVIYLKEFIGDKNNKAKIKPFEGFRIFQKAHCIAPKETPAAVLSFFTNVRFKEVAPEESIILEYIWETDGVNDKVEFYLPY